jgi:hypothetical protein
MGGRFGHRGDHRHSASLHSADPRPETSVCARKRVTLAHFASPLESLAPKSQREAPPAHECGQICRKWTLEDLQPDSCGQICRKWTLEDLQQLGYEHEGLKTCNPIHVGE